MKTVAIASLLSLAAPFAMGQLEDLQMTFSTDWLTSEGTVTDDSPVAGDSTVEWGTGNNMSIVDPDTPVTEGFTPISPDPMENIFTTDPFTIADISFNNDDESPIGDLELQITLEFADPLSAGLMSTEVLVFGLSFIPGGNLLVLDDFQQSFGGMDDDAYTLRIFFADDLDLDGETDTVIVNDVGGVDIADTYQVAQDDEGFAFIRGQIFVNTDEIDIPIPEPSTYAAMGALVLLGAIASRRFRK